MLLFEGCAAAGALATEGDADEDSRPFDLRRNGFVLGEGACLFAMETADAARQRNAKPMADIAGAGQAGGSVEELDSTLAHAMRLALDDAGIGAEEVGVVFAAANSGEAFDAAEARALWDVFGDISAPVCAVKSMLGETFGAGGPLALCAAALALRERTAPPTVNYEQGDEELTLAGVSQNTQPIDSPVALVNAMDPGGACSSLVLRT